MTSGGGFAANSQVWRVASDGSWSWVRKDKAMSADAVPSPVPERRGRLTEAQRVELALLATAPDLQRELRRSPGPCTVSDGMSERLDVGAVRYLANWCDEHRPYTEELRARIVALTTGD